MLVFTFVGGDGNKGSVWKDAKCFIIQHCLYDKKIGLQIFTL